MGDVHVEILTRRLLLALIMYFAADAAVPLEAGAGRLLIASVEDASATSVSAPMRVRPAAATRQPTRATVRRAMRIRSAPATRVFARRHRQSPPPLRVVSSANGAAETDGP